MIGDSNSVDRESSWSQLDFYGVEHPLARRRRIIQKEKCELVGIWQILYSSKKRRGVTVSSKKAAHLHGIPLDGKHMHRADTLGEGAHAQPRESFAVGFVKREGMVVTVALVGVGSSLGSCKERGNGGAHRGRLVRPA